MVIHVLLYTSVFSSLLSVYSVLMAFDYNARVCKSLLSTMWYILRKTFIFHIQNLHDVKVPKNRL